MSINITKEKFDEFEKIKKEGRYNMLDPQARALSSLTKKEWMNKKYIIDAVMFIVYNTIKYTMIVLGFSTFIWILFGNK